MKTLTPKIYTTLKQYSWSQFRTDVMSGVIVGIVALPLAIAFAVASGVSPDKGILTAIIAGFLISALGGSRVQIGGPTGAFIVIVYSVIEQFGIDGLIIATIMAGIILIVIGFLKFGSVIKFIPYPVTTGFTSGIAVIIFTTQIKDFLGLSIEKLPSDFVEKILIYKDNISSINISTVIIASLTILIISGWKKISKKIPGSIIALVVVTLIVHFLKLPIETIGSGFGDISQSIPYPFIPKVDFATIRILVPSAFAIAVLIAIESLLSAIVADGMTGFKHRSNMELIAQGIANIITPLFGGIPSTGAIARTAVNIHNGGRTPVAGIVHSITLLLIMFFLGGLAKLIPMAALAGILIVVAYNMSEMHSFIAILKGPKNDTIVLLVTFFLTVFLDLTIAIPIGMILASFLFINRIADTVSMPAIRDTFIDDEERDNPNTSRKRQIPEYVEIYEINGPFFFGIISTFTETMNSIENNPKIRILRMRHVPIIDATALNALKYTIIKAKKQNITILLSGVAPQIYEKLKIVGLTNLIGNENILSNIDEALIRAEAILNI